MSDAVQKAQQCRAIVRKAMETCKDTVPGVTPAHIMVALAAEAGYGMAILSSSARDQMFGALVSVMGQEAGLPVVATKAPGSLFKTN